MTQASNAGTTRGHVSAGVRAVAPVRRHGWRTGAFVGAAIAAGSVATMVLTRGSPASSPTPQPGVAAPPAATATTYEESKRLGAALTSALMDRRCDDARRVAHELAARSPAASDGYRYAALSCVPKPPMKAYPHTLVGAAQANTDGYWTAALAIIEELLASGTTDPNVAFLAVALSCAHGDADKARRFVSRIDDVKLRAVGVTECERLGITIP